MARSSKGGRYRKSAKIEALRECKDEILEAHRSGISIHRIAQIFWEGEGTPGKVSDRHPGAPSPGGEKKITYSLGEQVSPLVREEEFAKQLRLARYLAGASGGRPRAMEKAVEKARSITKPKPKAKMQPGSKKGVEAELARERRRAQPAGRQKGSSSGGGRSEKQRSRPSR